MRVFISQYNKIILVLSVVSYPQVNIKLEARVTSKCQATWLSFCLVHASHHMLKFQNLMNYNYSIKMFWKISTMILKVFCH